MKTRMILAVASAALLLAGCASVSTEPGTRFALMAPRQWAAPRRTFSRSATRIRILAPSPAM